MAALDGFSIPKTILRYFDLTASPYTDDYAREVSERRRSFPGGLLFLDQLLGLASIDAQQRGLQLESSLPFLVHRLEAEAVGNALYPPTSPAGLRRLIHTIRSAEIDRLKQDCFIYYLLLDCDDATDIPLPNGYGGYHADEEDISMEVVRVDNGKGKGKAKEMNSAQAEEFGNRRCLPQVWRGFIFGYWALDHGIWEDAVTALSNPAITSLNFLPGIFEVLSLRVSPPSLSLSLIHSLFTALSPPLDSESLISLRAVSLASASSLSNALNFIRSKPQPEQLKLRETVYLWALGVSRIPSGSGTSGVQGDVLTQLLHIPLQPEESTHLVDFLIHPPKSIPAPALDLLHELVTVRLIHQGQYAECLALDKELAGSGVGKEEDRQKRRERVKEFISILPEAQRRVLELEGEIRREEIGTRRNDIVQEQGDVEMPGSSDPKSSIPERGFPSGLVIPTPKRLPSLLSLAGESSAIRPSSPVPGRIMTPMSRNVSSPFAGPPQFARTDSPSAAPGTPGRGAPVQRLASGSPFVLPVRGVVDVPRPARRIIDDDDDDDEMNGDSDREVRKEARSMAPSAPSAEVPSPEEKENEQAEDMEVEQTQSQAPAEQNGPEKKMPPPPVPSTSQPQSKPPARKSSRQTIAPKPRDPSPPPPTSKPTSRSNRQRSTAPSNAESSTKDQKQNGDITPEIRGDSGHVMPGSFLSSSSSSLSAPTKGRSRMTRSASRAVLDDEDTPAPKKPRTRMRTAPSPAPSEVEGGKRTTRRGTREPSVASSTGGSRRETRSSVTPGPGRGGSPTGSVVSTRSRAGAREGSVTPRVTRTRK